MLKDRSNSIRLKYLILLSISFLSICCVQKQKDLEGDNKKLHVPNQKSVELNNKALSIPIFHADDSTNIKRVLNLLDQSTDIDPSYSVAYCNKISFLMMLNDYPRLLEANKKIIELRPKQPIWIVQRALIYELMGNQEIARIEYQRGIKGYESLISSDSMFSIDFEIEFAQSLILAEDSTRAQKIIEKLKNQHPRSEMWESFELLSKNLVLSSMNNQTNTSFKNQK